MSEEYARWDWSSRHVRVRTEMLLSSLVFAMISFYEIEGFNFLPVEFVDGSGLQGSVIFIIALVSAVFFIISFKFRTDFELAEKTGLDVLAQSSLSKLTESVSYIKDSMAMLEPEKFLEFKSELKRLLELEQSILKNSITAIDEYKKIHDDNSDLRLVIGRLSGTENFSAGTTKKDFQTLQPLVTSYQNHAPEKSFGIAEIEEVLKTYQKYYDSIDNLNNYTTQYKSLANGRSNSIVKNQDNLNHALHNAEAAFSPEKMGQLESLRSELSEFHKLISAKIQKSDRLQIVWLTYKLPYWFCIGLVFSSILHSIYNYFGPLYF